MYGMSGLLSGSAQGGMEAYASVGAIRGPVDRIAQSVALTNWNLYEQTETQGSVSRELLDDGTPPARHPATALWIQPNDYMSRRFFLLLQQVYQDTAGGCYWLLANREPQSPFPQMGMRSDLELWPIAPHRIQPIADHDTYLAGYVYTVGTEKIPLPVQSVIPVGSPDPRDPLHFLSPFAGMMPDIESEQYAAQFQRNTFLNDGSPGGVIEFDTPLSQDRFEEFVLRWREQHQGLSNVRRVAILEQAHWKDVAQSNRDMQYTELRRLSREHGMYALGMPFAMMVTQDVNLANSVTAEQFFDRYPLRYRLELAKEALNNRILPLIGDNLTFDYVAPSPQDEAFDTYQASSTFLSGIASQNEARGMVGLDALPEGDRFIFDLSGTAPPLATPPKTPTTLSYRKGQGVLPQHEDAMEARWLPRLEEMRRQYLDLLASRNGAH